MRKVCLIFLSVFAAAMAAAPWASAQAWCFQDISATGPPARSGLGRNGELRNSLEGNRA